MARQGNVELLQLLRSTDRVIEVLVDFLPHYLAYVSCYHQAVLVVSTLTLEASLLQLTTIQPPADGLGSARRHSPKRQDSSHCRCAVVFKLHFVLRKPLGYADKPGRLAGLGWNIRGSPSAIGSGIRMNCSSLARGLLI